MHSPFTTGFRSSGLAQPSGDRTAIVPDTVAGLDGVQMVFRDGFFVRGMDNINAIIAADVIFGLMHKCVEENARMALDQEDFGRRYSSLQERLDNTKQRLSRVTEQKLERIARRESITNFLRTLQQSDTCISAFDESLWNALAESVTVYTGKKLVFRFRHGMEVEIGLNAKF